MSKANAYENDILNLLFRATAIANVADNAASSPLTNLYIALHTADPGDAGDQTTSEAAYAGYARVAVARSAAGWGAASGGSISPAANIEFPTGTGGPGVGTHFSVGSASSGAGRIFYKGPISPNITFGNGVKPVLTTATVITED